MQELKKGQRWTQNQGCGNPQRTWNVIALNNSNGRDDAIVRASDTNEERIVSAGGQEDTFTFECFLNQED